MGPYDKPFSPQEYLMHYGVKGMEMGRTSLPEQGWYIDKSRKRTV